MPTTKHGPPRARPAPKSRPKRHTVKQRDRENLSSLGVLYVWQVAQELTVSEGSVLRLIREEKLRALRLGPRTVRVRRVDLEAYLAGAGAIA